MCSVLWGILRERGHLDDRELYGIILKLVFKKKNWGMDWIEVALDTDCLREMVNAVLKL